jgi:hypothetical protein
MDGSQLFLGAGWHGVAGAERLLIAQVAGSVGAAG